MRAVKSPKLFAYHLLEPVMDFDVPIFLDWIVALRPEYVWLGYNSKPKQVWLA